MNIMSSLLKPIVDILKRVGVTEYTERPIWKTEEMLVKRKCRHVLKRLVDRIGTDLASNFPYWMRSGQENRAKQELEELIHFRHKVAYVVMHANERVCKRCSGANRCGCAFQIKRERERVEMGPWTFGRAGVNLEERARDGLDHSRIPMEEIRAGFFELDQAIMCLKLYFGKTRWERTLAKKMKNWKTRFCAGKYGDRQRTVYLAWRPYSNQCYIGMTGVGTTQRHLQHWAMALGRNEAKQYLYRKTEGDFHKFMFCEIAQFRSSMPDRTIRYVESMAIRHFRASLNTQQRAIEAGRANKIGEVRLRSEAKSGKLARRRQDQGNKEGTNEGEQEEPVADEIRASHLAEEGIFQKRQKMVVDIAKGKLGTRAKAWIKRMGKRKAGQLENLASRSLTQIEYTSFRKELMALRKDWARETGYKNVRIEVHKRTAAQGDIEKHIRNIHKGQQAKGNILVEIEKKKSTSIVELFQKNDIEQKCNCRALKAKYPFLQTCEGHVVDNFNRVKRHFGIRENWCARTRIVESEEKVMSRVTKQLMQVRRRIGGKPEAGAIEKDREIARMYYQSLQEEEFREEMIGDELKEICGALNCQPVDKEKGNMGMTCGEVIRQLSQKYLRQKYSRIPSLEVADLIENGDRHNFFKLKNDNNSIPVVKKHKWSKLKIFIKKKAYAAMARGEVQSIEQIKFRPLISYFHNRYKHYYSATCKALNYLLGETSRTVCNSTLDFVEKVEEYNKNPKPNLKIVIEDISNFYPNANVEEGAQLIEETVDKVTGKGYTHVAIAKPRPYEKILMDCHKNRGNPRRGMRTARTRRQKVKLIKGGGHLPYKTHYVMRLNFIPEVVNHALKYAIVICRGAHAQQQGAPIGSPLGYALSNAFAISVERRKPQAGIILRGRYVDDRLTAYDWDNMTEEQKEAALDDDYYGEDCKLERSTQQEFCGMEVIQLKCGRLILTPMAQHYYLHGKSVGLAQKTLMQGHLHRMKNYSNRMGYAATKGEITHYLLKKLKFLEYDAAETRKGINTYNSRQSDPVYKIEPDIIWNYWEKEKGTSEKGGAAAGEGRSKPNPGRPYFSA